MKFRLNFGCMNVPKSLLKQFVGSRFFISGLIADIWCLFPIKSALKVCLKKFCNQQIVLSVIKNILSLCGKVKIWTGKSGMRHLAQNLGGLLPKYLSHSAPNLVVRQKDFSNNQWIPPSGDAISQKCNFIWVMIYTWYLFNAFFFIYLLQHQAVGLDFWVNHCFSHNCGWAAKSSLLTYNQWISHWGEAIPQKDNFIWAIVYT